MSKMEIDINNSMKYEKDIFNDNIILGGISDVNHQIIPPISYEIPIVMIDDNIFRKNECIENLKRMPLTMIDKKYDEKSFVFSQFDIKMPHNDNIDILKKLKIITYNDLIEAKKDLDSRNNNFSRRERNAIDKMYDYYTDKLTNINNKKISDIQIINDTINKLNS